MTARTGGDLVNAALVALGVRHVFGIVSVHNIPIFDAIARGGAITPIAVRHEQGALHAADGYARATGGLGVAITSTGPGATNAMTGLFEAGFASSRVLMITGQTETRYYGKGRGVLHEAEQQLPMLRSVARATASPRSVEEIAPELFRVARDILSGRPQPGAIEIPVDLQYASSVSRVPAWRIPEPAAPDATLVTRAGTLLAGGGKRLILAGGGVVSGGAERELLKLAEALEAPVFTTINGRGAIPEDHPLAMGVFLAQCRDLLVEADTLLAVGTRFQGGATANFTVPMARQLIHLDADPRVIGLNYPATVALTGDARLGLKGLADASNAQPGDSEFNGRVRAASQSVRERALERIGPDYRAIMTCIRGLLPRDGNVVRDATVPAYTWGNNLLPILAPRTSVGVTSAAIGPALPLAIGASVGSRARSVVIQGDGGFMLNIGELATAAQYQVPVVVCLFNDGGYGVLRGIQAASFEGRQVNVDLATPDFAAVAEAMGVKGRKVSGIREFESEFAAAMGEKGPVLLDIDMSSLAPMQRGRR